MSFELHPRLAADSLFVASLPLCQLRLINDCRYPWLLLVPQRDAVREITQLNEQDYQQLWQEVRQTSVLLQNLKQPEKLNIATLGNLVPQLHLHVIGRFSTDPAWPGPVWGQGTAEPYTPAQAEILITALKQRLDSVQ